MWCRRGELFGKAPGVSLRDRPIHLGRGRYHDMQALAAGQFGPRLVSFRSQELAELQRCLDHERPRDALSGVEIKHERVRPVDIVDRGTPWMDLDGPDLHEPEKPIEAIDPQPGALLAPALAH